MSLSIVWPQVCIWFRIQTFFVVAIFTALFSPSFIALRLSPLQVAISVSLFDTNAREPINANKISRFKCFHQDDHYYIIYKWKSNLSTNCVQTSFFCVCSFLLYKRGCCRNTACRSFVHLLPINVTPCSYTNVLYIIHTHTAIGLHWSISYDHNRLFFLFWLCKNSPTVSWSRPIIFFYFCSILFV